MPDAILDLTIHTLEPACRGRLAGGGPDLGEEDILRSAARPC